MSLPQRPLGDALQLASKKVPVSADEEYRIAGIYSFGRGLIKRPTITGAETSYPTLTRIETDQLAMSKLNAWEGALAIVTDEFSGAHVSPEYPVFDINRDVADPAYIKHLIAWPTLWSRLTPRGSMVRRKRTTPATLMATVVPLPDLEEQRRIAARLDTALAKFEQVEGLREHRSRLCAALVESTVAHALEQSTQSVRLGACLVASRTPIEIDPDQQYQAFGMRSFGRGTIRYPTAKGSELSKLRYYKFPSDTLALSNIKAWEGAIHITSEEDTACVASNRFLFYSTIGQRINIRFLKHYLLSRQGLAQVSACSPGSADRNRTLSIKRFEGLQVPLPAREEQDRVANLLDAITEEVRPDKIQETQAALRTSLLNAAFNGGL